MSSPDILQELAAVIAERKRTGGEQSYTARLFREGTDTICKKIAEESGEVIIAAQQHDPSALRAEAADLLYHLLVLLAAEGVTLDEALAELAARRQKTSPP